MEKRNIKVPWPSWTVEERLGRGAFGEVYRIKREEYGNVSYAALKIVRIPSETEDVSELESSGISPYSYYEGMVTDLTKEIAVMESLKGASHIVSIEDYEIEKKEEGIGWTIYIRMELLKNLNEYRREHAMDIQDIIRLGCDICTALEACQRKQIVHRDIKPSNVFISEFGEYKLGDFGISRHLEHTMSGLSRKGTMTYMAPEIQRGDTYGSTVDIYSMGLMLFQMANGGRMPFLPPVPINILPKDAEEAMARRLSGEELPDPAMGGKAFGDIIRKACRIEPGERYQNAAQMKAALLACKPEEEDRKQRAEKAEELKAEEEQIEKTESFGGGWGSPWVDRNEEKVEQQEMKSHLEERETKRKKGLLEKCRNGSRFRGFRVLVILAVCIILVLLIKLGKRHTYEKQTSNIELQEITLEEAGVTKDKEEYYMTCADEIIQTVCAFSNEDIEAFLKTTEDDFSRQAIENWDKVNEQLGEYVEIVSKEIKAYEDNTIVIISEVKFEKGKAIVELTLESEKNENTGKIVRETVLSMVWKNIR